MTPPQGRLLPGDKGKIIRIIATIVIFALAGGYLYSRALAGSTPTSQSQTQTALVRSGDLTVSASGSGTLIAQTAASFGFDASGQVTAVYVKVGERVEAGQVLAKLDDTLAKMKYEEAQQALRELHSPASIAMVQQEIATAQDTEAAAKEWLAYLISPEVVEAEDNLATAQQKLADAQATAQANPSDTATQAVRQAEQAVAYLNDKLSQAWTYYADVYVVEKFGEYETVGGRRHRKQVLVMTTDPITGQEVPVVDSSVAELAAARNKLAQAQETISEGQTYLDILKGGVIPEDAVGPRITALYKAQQAVEEAKTDLEATELFAPISGTVTSSDLHVGEQAGSSSIVTISQLSQPYVLNAYLDEADWNLAQVGNKAIVTFDLLPEKTYTGTVALVYPELESSFEFSVVHLTVQLDQSISQDLPVGTGATVEVIGGEVKGALLVSADAVHKADDGKTYVTILQNGRRVERQVTIGLQNETFAEVTSGLEAGETVVTQ